MSQTALLHTLWRRPPEMVMRLERMGAAFPTRLSFLPTLIRRLVRERAQLERTLWEIDDNCVGCAVYTIRMGGRPYSLIAFSTPLPPEQRTDRVIAEAWDAAFVLYDGVPDRSDLDRLRDQAPKQEAGRFTERELVLSRANRSERAFGHAAARLAAGQRPDPDLLASVGYLMRTTAVYGNGKFGIADRSVIAHRPELAGPFQAEMLTVWLIRAFTLDLVEHAAQSENPSAATLTANERRALGVGNATGLGMAPFLVNHPELVDQWVNARETALAQARARPSISPETQERALALLAGAQRHAASWRVSDALQSARIAVLEQELEQIAHAAAETLSKPYPIEALLSQTDSASLEMQELIAALTIDTVEDCEELAERMSADETRTLDPRLSVGAFRQILNVGYLWARDSIEPEDARYFWYVSEEKLEPRLGVRGMDAGEDRETPLDIGRRIHALWRDLSAARNDESVAVFLMRHPEHRAMVRRAQSLRGRVYAEVQDNLVGAACRPIDLLRFKLSFLGAAYFDPKSDRWTRIALARGAPEPQDVAAGRGADWSPVFNTGVESGEAA
ncbi:MAG: hypothetical protein KTR21_06950 [Rhodobacteraceae bacterium]|nr:hypothetical protein [Paracoccaceae bacterium]